MKALMNFELRFFVKRAWFYIMLLLFVLLGIFTGSKANAFTLDNTLKNAPFAITYMLGFMSLMCIFVSAILSAQVLFRERDANFALILYTTPIHKRDYLLSRFTVIFGITLLSFFLFVSGFCLGREMEAGNSPEYGPFNAWHYLQPFLLLGVPNALFCSTVTCFSGFVFRNKLLVYISGLFIYIAYMVALIFSGSPLMAGGFPPSAEAMNLSAILDPFGLSAFMQETLFWSSVQRNTQVMPLAGNMLFNRLLYSLVSCAALLLSFRFFSFSQAGKQRKKAETPLKERSDDAVYKRLLPDSFGPAYILKSMLSLIRLDIRFVIKSTAFVLILIGACFMISMEIYAEIEKGIRLPERYASTGLMVNTILEVFPLLCLLIIIFYSSELVWQSKTANFYTIENTTPLSAGVRFFAKWLSLNIIILLLTIWMIVVGIVFQVFYGYYVFEWPAYAALFFLVSLPLMLSAGVLVAIQWMIRHKYAGLVVSSCVVLLTATSIGKILGITYPLMRFHAAFSGSYSDMNGWGAYLHAFGYKMFFGGAVTLLLALAASTGLSSFRHFSLRKIRPLFALSVVALLGCAALNGVYISRSVDLTDDDEVLDWQEQYEKTYRPFQDLPQPSITDVKTRVDLFPEQNRYAVKGTYVLKNNSARALEDLLLYENPNIVLRNLHIDNGALASTDTVNGYYRLHLSKPLQPGEESTLHFEFDYSWNAFRGHESVNAIVENGSFMRLSRYYPQFGYQSDHEIADEQERTKRQLGAASALKKLDAPRSGHPDFINLEMDISTSKDQTAIGIGELVKTWNTGNRNYFQYKTLQPVAFRFGLSSARYTVKKVQHRDVDIEIWYHARHVENVDHLIENVQHTLDYCIDHFGPYPFKTIRFAEVSAFTRGFAASAYPATIFMPEDKIFHVNIKGDKQQDVINELAGHELSHEWWGSVQFKPDEREGAAFLSETMAMYTELMLVKKMYGSKRVLENVKMRHDIYLSERSFFDEQALTRTTSDNTHQHYSKGLVVMYQLCELIGEERVNEVLRNLYLKHRYPAPPPISTDFLEELYALTDKSLHTRISDMFEKICTFEFGIRQAKYSSVDKVLNISFDAQKYYEDKKGARTLQPLHDSIDIAAYYAGDRREIKRVALSDTQIQWPLSEKPGRLVLDPYFKFIKIRAETAEKKVTDE